MGWQSGSRERTRIDLLAMARQVRGAMISDDNDPGACNCLVRSAEVEIALVRQAKLEATVRYLRPDR